MKTAQYQITQQVGNFGSLTYKSAENAQCPKHCANWQVQTSAFKA